jgi:hypothetical protein
MAGGTGLRRLFCAAAASVNPPVAISAAAGLKLTTGFRRFDVQIAR